MRLSSATCHVSLRSLFDSVFQQAKSGAPIRTEIDLPMHIILGTIAMAVVPLYILVRYKQHALVTHHTTRYVDDPLL